MYELFIDFCVHSDFVLAPAAGNINCFIDFRREYITFMIHLYLRMCLCAGGRENIKNVQMVEENNITAVNCVYIRTFVRGLRQSIYNLFIDDDGYDGDVMMMMLVMIMMVLMITVRMMVMMII